MQATPPPTTQQRGSATKQFSVPRRTEDQVWLFNQKHQPQTNKIHEDNIMLMVVDKA